MNCPNCYQYNNEGSASCQFCGVQLPYGAQTTNNTNYAQPGQGNYYGSQFQTQNSQYFQQPYAQNYPSYPPHAQYPYAPGLGFAKSKSVAIICAIFLGPWTWLYTYKRNKVKFWVTVPIYFILVVAYITAVSRTVTSCPAFNTSNCPYSGDAAISAIILLILSLTSLASWLWALIDSIVASVDFYRYYPWG